MTEPKKRSEAANRQRDIMGAALRRTPTTGPETTAPARRPVVPRVKPVRTTLDLEPDLHQRIKVWLATEGLTFSDVFRVLAERLLDDPALADEIQRRVREVNDRQ